MPTSKPLMDPLPAHADVQSALRTLEAGSNGIAAISAALNGPLASAFIAAVELIRNAKGRAVIIGLG